MIHSMTGYSSTQGQLDPWRWSFELRSVNGRGLDLRIRVPDWIEGLEPAIRAALGKAVARGNVSCSIRVSREAEDGALQLNAARLDAVLAALSEAETRAMDAGLSLAPSTAADVVALRGVLEQGGGDEDTSPLKAELLAALPDAIDAFNASRAQEGKALGDLLAAQLDEIASLTETAADMLAKRKDDMADNLRRNVERLLSTNADMDEARIAQELAVLAVKTDVTEEIDRLRTHVAAAREHLATGGAVGRKLDFLMQEFNREANTLCSKAQMAALTETGLQMKVVIDQMREQVQNVE